MSRDFRGVWESALPLRPTPFLCDHQPVANMERIRDHAGRYQGTIQIAGGDGEYKASDNTPSVFISYASQDAEAARHICDALRTAGLEVWFDSNLGLGRHGDAETALAKIKVSMGDAAAFQYAETYAQWGDLDTALQWLETAFGLRDPGLEDLETDSLIDPLRKEPRFLTIERLLQFPSP
jgi:hypothetical protein